MNFDAYSNDSLGPIQKDEAIFLYGLALAVRPQRVLEFGTLRGDSTAVWLSAGVPSVISVDSRITPEARKIAHENPQLELVQCDQTAYIPPVFVDLVFMDASHDLNANKTTFANILHMVREGGLIIIHDTGLWSSDHMTDAHKRFPGNWEAKGFAHQPDERKFVEWVDQSYALPRIHIHTLYALRHGMTIYQNAESIHPESKP